MNHKHIIFAAIAAIFPLSTLAISAPSITSCTRTTSTSVSLSWTAVSGASYYVVYRGTTTSPTAASTASITTTSSTSYTDSQAGVDTCYYWVEAWDSGGDHARSGMATASSGSGSGGSGSGSFTISASDGTSTDGVVITWSDQNSSGGYRVVRGTSSNMDYASILVETVTGITYTDTTATVGTTYYYWIVAKKTSGYLTSSYDTGYRRGSASSGITDDMWGYYIDNETGEAIIHGSQDQRTIPSSTSVRVTTPRVLGGCPVTEISSMAFYLCESLPGITVSVGVRRIGAEAFYGCKELTSISLPSTLTNIGDEIFRGCSSLTSLTIPPCVTNIGHWAFFGCGSLASLKLPARFRGNTSDLAVPSNCSVSYWGTPTLSVVSDYGSPSPSGTGVQKTSGSSLTCSVSGSPVADSANSDIRHVCTGWMGVGSIPASGTGTSVTFTISDDSLLVWKWKVQNKISVTSSGSGSCAFGTKWVDDGTIATATIVPSVRPYSITLTGDTNGVSVSGANISIPSDRPRNIAVSIAGENAEVVNITRDSTTGYTMTDWNTYVVAKSVSFSNSAIGGSGMSVADSATAVLYVPAGVTLTVTGANGSGQTGGAAGIHVPESSTLIITGEGTINTTGGKAGNGQNGEDGKAAAAAPIREGQIASGTYAYSGLSGSGGKGGFGGGGAGAGIGGFGGTGGQGGSYGWDAYGYAQGPYAYPAGTGLTVNGCPGGDGKAGAASAPMGTVYLIGTVRVNASSGGGGTAGNAGASSTVRKTSTDSALNGYACCGGGGGGGGGAGAAAECAIGSGGLSGGGGGGGGSGAISYSSSGKTPACGGGGEGGKSPNANGGSGSAAGTLNYKTGGAGGAGGAAGSAGSNGTLYVAPTVAVNVSRTMQSATTHAAAQYTITFNADGGTLPSGGQSATATLGCVLPSINVPTRTGFTFGGYYTAKNGSGTQYYTTAGASARSWDKPEATTLYAVWTANPYSVKFNANGGSGTMSNESFTYGTAKALTANAFTRTGYTFAGWATNATGSKVYDDKQTVQNLTTTSGGTVNLYAVWTANPYSVKFNANGGSGTMSNESFTYGTAKALTANAFTRTGYTFAGWATNATGSKVYDDKQTVQDLTTTSGGTVNLYAVWTANTYAVKFNANSGSGTMSNESFTYDSTKALSANTFTRTGYSFAGWATSANGAKIYDNGQPVSNLTATANGTVNLYAKWTANTYSVKFNANTGSGSMSNESFTYGTAQALTANAFTRTGYTFSGWATSATGAKVYNDKQSVSNLTETAGATVNLYAKWTANTYAVKFNANGGSGTMLNESFAYGTAKALTANAFTRTGYTHSGWATSANGAKVYDNGQPVSNLTATANGTVNLYAKWTANTYSVKFNANTGSGSMSNESFTYGTAKSLTANAFTRTGYTFSGWATSASGAKAYDNGQSVSNLTATAGATVNLYAKWTANTYSVKFNANGGNGSMSNQSFTYDAAKALTANAFMRTGYTFGGWASSASGAKVYDNGQSVSNLTATANGTANLYAAWTANTYAVTLDRQGGSGGSESVTATYDAAMPTITVPTREHFAFGGYYTASNGGGTQYYTATGAIARNWDKTEATTLYAKWNPTQYKISVTATGAGSCSFGTQWVDVGTTAAATVVLSSSSYRIKVMGDNDGVTVDSTTVSIPATKTRNITISVTTDPEIHTYHVDAANGSDSNDGLSWVTAKKTIQNAVDLAYGGDMILVADGIYSPITAQCLGIEIRSVNGAVSTIIDGGGAHTRCAFLGYYTNDVVKTKLVGFTLRNGIDQHGTGAYGGALEDCVVTGNYAAQDNGTTFCGGGLYNCMATRCVISNNVASRAGGGAWCSELADCLVVGNHVQNNEDGFCGGGTARSRLVRCTVADNTAVPGVSSTSAAGADSCILQSCIVYGNTYTTGASSDVNNSTATYSCFGSAVSGAGNIVANPLFANAANGDYRLTAGSPCIDKGVTSDVTWHTVDLDGAYRRVGPSVDMGCYEFSTHREPTTIHVDVATGDDANDGLSSSAPKQSIQSALEWSIDGDTILVADGVYTRNKDYVVYNDTLNRIVTIQSVNGPERAVIDGGGMRRCVKLSAYDGRTSQHVATLSGFTITNGTSYAVGGVMGGVVENCIIVGCTGTRAFNSTGNYSGGAWQCKLVNCLILNNTIVEGSGVPASGGAGSCDLYNCTIVGNTAVAGAPAGGLYNCKAYNCIAVGNTVDGAAVDVASGCTVANSCLGASFSGAGNIVADPLFADAANSDYRLSADSPCIGAGDNAKAAGETDLAGGTRLQGLSVDMGCYEWQGSPATPVVTPADGTILEGTANVTMSCATDGATIHYTIDGSEPTEASPTYRRFRVSGRTTVKAVAVKDGLCSEVAVAEYAMGRCEAPVITAATSFTGLKTSVALSCATQVATIRYTLDGSDPGARSTPYMEPFDVTESCTVKAYATHEGFFDSAVVSFSIEKVWGIGDTMGDPDQSFTTGGDMPFVRVDDVTAPLGESMKSGAITHNQSSTMTTTVDGPGTVSFQWRTSCEDSGGQYDWDHAEFEVDGNVAEYLDGETAWQTVSREISGNGSHTLVWRYVKDDVESEGEDCCWVADFRWTAYVPEYTETQTTDTPVPYSWLSAEAATILAAHGGDYEEAAKATAANGVNKVWECYVAGISPTNAAARFEVTIEIGADGKPVVRWNPPLAPEEEAKRTRKVLGKRTLDPAEDWTDVTDLADPDAAGYRFFKAAVALPEK